MTNPRNVDATPLNPPDLEGEAKARQLAGLEIEDDKDPVLETSEVDLDRQNVTGQMLYEGEMGQVGTIDLVDDPEALELLEDRELRAGETNDPYIAAEEGLTYVPPSDPPVVPSSDPQGAVVAAGFASSALDDPYDAGHHQEAVSEEDEMTDRVREALLADSMTSRYAEQLEIETDGGRVWLRGTVDDVEDSDALIEVASRVAGVSEVLDETELAE